LRDFFADLRDVFRVVFFAFREDVPDERDVPPRFVSPDSRRCLLTVAAAMRLAVAVLRPRFLADALIFSY
jgi:hypothetical protein